MSKPIIIQVKQVRLHGLDTYQVIVSGTLLSTYMSEQAAEDKKNRCIYAWNIERAGDRKRA